MNTSFKIVLLLLLLSVQLLRAQENKPNTLYQIQLGAYETEVDWSKFKPLIDLGLISSNSISFDEAEEESPLAKVFLGKYLGEATVKKVLGIVKQRGFKNVSIEKDDYTLTHSTGKYIQYTVQLGAFNSLDMSKFIDVENSQNLFIWYEGGSFKVIYGLYPSAEDAEEARKYLISEGYPGLVKNFR